MGGKQHWLRRKGEKGSDSGAEHGSTRPRGNSEITQQSAYRIQEARDLKLGTDLPDRKPESGEGEPRPDTLAAKLGASTPNSQASWTCPQIGNLHEPKPSDKGRASQHRLGEVLVGTTSTSWSQLLRTG